MIHGFLGGVQRGASRLKDLVAVIVDNQLIPDQQTGENLSFVVRAPRRIEVSRSGTLISP